MNNGLPEFPIELLDAINNKRLILFLGAGISCNAGARSWGEISKLMLEDFKNNNIIEDSEYSELKLIHHYVIFERLKQKSPQMYKEKFTEYLHVKDLKIINVLVCFGVMCFGVSFGVRLDIWHLEYEKIQNI